MERNWGFCRILQSRMGHENDGIQPESGLIVGKFGLLYGTTEMGGASGAGTVFGVVK